MEAVKLVRRIHFSSGHSYSSSLLSEDENKRAYGASYQTEGLGHNFVVEAHFLGQIDPLTGMVINLMEIDAWLKAVSLPLDHHYLNLDVPEFKNQVPTTENLAKYFFNKLETEMTDRSKMLAKIVVLEGESLSASYSRLP